ncbi:DUF4265 domain-containing protein [Cerasicoccus maritimus]|uniref:DUF4265 domain-containing protein n=1 Tax=Cerasicoccus maritimus TaxID=490089 RepID=UPI00285268C8|nr:DUF4265 domain-containing protein [Cerasicoccus maritimus]
MANPLEKILVYLPNSYPIASESFWAAALGNELYRLENVPFFAYGLNFKDVVLATPNRGDPRPEIRKVVTPSGHKTCRVLFSDATSRSKQSELLDQLAPWGGLFERANDSYVAIDIQPDGDYAAIYSQLERYAVQQYL